MSATLDSLFNINVNLDAPPITRAGFGTVMTLVSGESFAERVRYYGSAKAAADDSELSATGKAIVAAAYSQAQKPRRFAIGRRGADVAQVDTVTVVASTDGDYTVTINGVDFTHTASTETVTNIRDALILLINGGSEPVTAAASSTDAITLTADVAGTPFTTTVSTGITLANTTPNVSIYTELEACLSPEWYAFTISTRNDTDIERAAAFALAYERPFAPQTDSTDVADSQSNVYGDIEALSNRYVYPIYHPNDAEYQDVATFAYFFCADFDVTAPTVEFLTLSGVTPPTITGTQEVNLRANNVNWYSTLKGVGATANGQVSAGFDLEYVVTAAWAKARISEAIAQLFLDTSARLQRIQYNDAGFARITGVVENFLQTAERAGHANPGTVVVVTTPRSELSATQIANGNYSFPWGFQYSGRVKTIDVTGYISVNFAGFE